MSGSALLDQIATSDNDVQINRVVDKKALHEFVTFPFKLYRNDPNWVPPLIEERLDFLNPRKNPFFDHARYMLFLAQRHGETVGTIAAVVDDNYNQYHSELMGTFGFFETIDDPSVGQALLAAKAGAYIISPFVGRLDDVGANGMDLIRQIVTIYKNYNFKTQVLAASLRSPNHVIDSALAGAHIGTAPFKVYDSLFNHPLTDKGLDQFLKDYRKVFEEVPVNA